MLTVFRCGRDGIVVLFARRSRGPAGQTRVRSGSSDSRTWHRRHRHHLPTPNYCSRALPTGCPSGIRRSHWGDDDVHDRPYNRSRRSTIRPMTRHRLSVCDRCSRLLCKRDVLPHVLDSLLDFFLPIPSLSTVSSLQTTFCRRADRSPRSFNTPTTCAGPACRSWPAASGVGCPFCVTVVEPVSGGALGSRDMVTCKGCVFKRRRVQWGAKE